MRHPSGHEDDHHRAVVAGFQGKENGSAIMSLRTKLITIFLALLIVFGVKSFYTSKSLDALGVLATDMYDGPVTSVNYVQISARNFTDANAFLSQTLQFDNRVDWQKAIPEFKKQIDTLLQNLAIVKERAA